MDDSDLTGYWEYDTISDQLFWSPEMYWIHGIDESEPIPSNRDLLDQIHPEDQARWLYFVNNLYKSKTRFHFEFRMTQKDTDNIRYLVTTGSVKTIHRNETKELILIGITQDITSTRKLTGKRDRMERLFDLTDPLLHGVDDFDHTLESVFELLIDSHLFENIRLIQNAPTGDGEPILVKYWKKAPSTLSTFVPSGEARALLDSIEVPESCLHIGEIFIDDTPWGYLQTVHVPTIRIPCYLIDNWLTILAFVLQSSIRRGMKDDPKNQDPSPKPVKAPPLDFIAKTSHEIRTQINGITGILDLLMESSLNHQQSNYTRLIHNSVDSLLTIVNDVLDFSKIDANKMIIKREKFNVFEMIEDLVDVFQPRASSRSMGISYFVSPEIREYLIGDSNRIKQILINYIDNAIKYAEKGEIRLLVEPDENDPKKREIRFTVEDTGAGIPESLIDKIFLPYEQGDRPPIMGTGLGLAISSKLAILMGGRTGASSELNMGSSFWVSLPLVESEDRQERFKGSCLLYTKNETTICYFKKYYQTLDSKLEIVKSEAGLYYRLNTNNLGIQKFDSIVIDLTGEKNDLSLKGLIGSGSVPHTIEANLVLPDFESAGTCDIPTNWRIMVSFFHFSIFFNENRQPDDRVGKSSGKNPESSKYLNKKILLVEDNSINLMILSSMLQNFGMAVDHAENGKEAVEILEKQAYDLVFMDIEMPVMNGFDATTHIRGTNFPEINRNIPIVALTAHEIHEIRDKCILAGMNDSLTKPFVQEEIHKICERFLFSGPSSPIHFSSI